MLNLKNGCALAEILSTSASLAVTESKFGIVPFFGIIKVSLKITVLVRDCISEMEIVSDKEREAMSDKVKSLQKNLQEIRQHIHEQQEIELDKNEITALFSELQKIAKLLKDMDEQAKHPWYKRMWGQPMTKMFNAMKGKIDFAFQQSILIVNKLNLKVSLKLKDSMERQNKIIEKMESELGALRLQYNTLNKCLCLCIFLVFVLCIVIFF